MCLVVNLFAGPGSGKSTTCAGVFSKLKLANINCEMALEYAKEKVWENNMETLKDQIYVFAHQLHRLNRLKNKVDVIITDSPLLLSIIYDRENNHHFNELVISEFQKFDNINFYIKRNDFFNQKGRIQTLEESIKKDEQISNLLKKYNVPHIFLNKENAIDSIVEDVLNQLKGKK